MTEDFNRVEDIPVIELKIGNRFGQFERLREWRSNGVHQNKVIPPGHHRRLDNDLLDVGVGQVRLELKRQRSH